jgi:cytochrome c553
MARTATVVSLGTGARWRASVGVAAALLALPPAWAADAQAGQRKSQPCMVCHGQWGLGVAPDAPHLAGQPQAYLAAQLQAFRSGARKHEVMSVIARPLSDVDIADLAAWYASIEIEVKPR